MNFALFVGAVNIIFTPFIGLQAGIAVWPATTGFLLTGMGLTVVTAVAMARSGGSMAALTRPTARLCDILQTVYLLPLRQTAVRYSQNGYGFVRAGAAGINRQLSPEQFENQNLA
ncbi:hypothetical protein A6A26_24055 (plasmid) [Pantoea sp. OXWO6B1]|nr:branched-chain amino acid transport system II carrier protein [Pantoea sp. OXWO6B1]OAD98021.1 hypothetical protein A6A26_24055 [Pantoea sp. OXWO6B1]